jgi:hypothetical protein
MLHQYTIALTLHTWNKSTRNEGHSHKHVHRQIIPTRCFRALYLRIRASTSCLAASACIFCTMSVRVQISKQMKCVLQHSIKISYMHTCTQCECMKYKVVQATDLKLCIRFSTAIGLQLHGSASRTLRFSPSAE